MDKEFESAVTAIWERYKVYGIQHDMIRDLMKTGMEANGLTTVCLQWHENELGSDFRRT